MLATAAAGYALAPPVPGLPRAAWWFRLVEALAGTALVAAGTNALNQVLERDVDALMRRTAARPLPAGRLHVGDAAAFAALCGVLGVWLLAERVNALTALLAAFTLLSYVGAYTPLKRRTSLATLIGAVPGALPIVGGWTAAGGALDAGAASLFAILFFWQLPHFLALSWIYRDDYARAGLRMLSVGDPEGDATFRQARLQALVLVPVSLLPAALSLAGPVYFIGAAALSSWFARVAVTAARDRSHDSARRLFRASLVYLPAILGLLVLDRVS